MSLLEQSDQLFKPAIESPDGEEMFTIDENDYNITANGLNWDTSPKTSQGRPSYSERLPSIPIQRFTGLGQDYMHLFVPLRRLLLKILYLSLIHISEPTRLGMISYAVFCLKKKNILIF
eukprot:TRINITY_DN12682_c0_g1_i4.p2 TRINITY_DN12682_c0_g1~~TRINITY_DN12682_c0_g1_i4.p2  ORF type:complete len:119 (-),score=15.28 TRINITY_DN12682_c0_g1_i4:26-382(-)